MNKLVEFKLELLHKLYLFILQFASGCTVFRS